MGNQGAIVAFKPSIHAGDKLCLTFSGSRFQHGSNFTWSGCSTEDELDADMETDCREGVDVHVIYSISWSGCDKRRH